MAKSRLYTGTGDKGTTSLVTGERRPKNDVRIEAYGTVDELNSWLGLLAASPALSPEWVEKLRGLQNVMFDLGSYLACQPDDEGNSLLPSGTGPERIAALERMIDALDSLTPPVNRFVLPGPTADSARAHIARTVCRRAERRMLDLAETEHVDRSALIFVNRLSDFLFILARYFNTISGSDEIFWQKDCCL